MAVHGRIISVKLNDRVVQMLDEACRKAGFNSRSPCIRTLIMSFIHVMMRDEASLEATVPLTAVDVAMESMETGNDLDVRSIAVAAALVAANEFADEVIALAEELREMLENANIDTLPFTAKISMRRVFSDTASLAYNPTA